MIFQGAAGARGEIMTVKEYLRSIRDEQRELWILQDKRNEIYFNLLPSGIRYDKDHIQISSENAFPDKVIKMAELSNKIDKKIEHLTRRKADALDMIGRLDNTNYRQVLILYYIPTDDRKMMSWLDVAEEMGYSEDWVKHIHGYALKELSEFYVDRSDKKK